jgi:hypothetical protein
MTVNRRLYPPKTIWQAMRLERLQQVGYVCEMCGVPDAVELFNADRPHPFYAAGTPYRQYLQLAHKRQYEKWNRSADCAVLCPSCHAKLDAPLRRKRSTRYPSSVGLVEVWVWYQGEKLLAAVSRYFDEVFEVIGSFEEGWCFEVCAMVLLRFAGLGQYRKQADGVEVLHEQGVCESFGLLVQEVLSGVIG